MLYPDEDPETADISKNHENWINIGQQNKQNEIAIFKIATPLPF